MNYFDQIGSAEISEKSAWFVPGKYRVWVECLKMNETNSGMMFFAETHILSTDVEDKHLQAGSDATWMAKMANRASPGAVKKNIAGIAGIASDDVDSAGAEAVVSTDNPLRGIICDVVARNIKTKAGADFTLVDFLRCDDATQEQADALHAAAGF